MFAALVIVRSVCFQCTRTCQGGVQYRKVTCVGGSTCDLELEPPAQQPCGGEPCPETAVDNSTEIERMPTTLSPTEEDSQTTSVSNSNPGDSLVLNSADDGLSPGPEAESESTNIVLGGSSFNRESSDENQVIPSSSNDADLSSTKSIGSKDTPPVPEHKRRHHHNKPHHKHDHTNQEQTVVLGDVNSAGKQSVASETRDAGEDTTKTEKDEAEASDAGRHEEGEEEEEGAEEQKGAAAEGDFEWYAGEWRKVSMGQQPPTLPSLCPSSDRDR